MTTKASKDYSQGKIYKIEATVEHDEGDIYIGSTTTKYLSQRFVFHRGDYKRWKEGKRNLVTSFILFEKYGVENCQIVLQENVNASNYEELAPREAYYIKTLLCVNKIIPLRTKADYKKDHREVLKKQNQEYTETHKDKISEYQKQYRIEHKEEMCLYNKIYQKENEEALKEKMKEYYQNNKEKIKEQCTKYREENKEEILKRQREYRQKKKQEKESLGNAKTNSTILYLSLDIYKMSFREIIEQELKEMRPNFSGSSLKT